MNPWATTWMMDTFTVSNLVTNAKHGRHDPKYTKAKPKRLSSRELKRRKAQRRANQRK